MYFCVCSVYWYSSIACITLVLSHNGVLSFSNFWMENSLKNTKSPTVIHIDASRRSLTETHERKKFRIKVQMRFLTHPRCPAGILEQWVVCRPICAETPGWESRPREAGWGFILTCSSELVRCFRSVFCVQRACPPLLPPPSHPPSLPPFLFIA